MAYTPPPILRGSNADAFFPSLKSPPLENDPFKLLEANRPTITVATRDKVRQYYLSQNSDQQRPGLKEKINDKSPQLDIQSQKDKTNENHFSKPASSLPRATNLNHPDYYSEVTEESSASDPHLEPELIHPDVETSYSDLDSSEHEEYHHPHQQYNIPNDTAFNQEDNPHSPSPLRESPLQPPMPRDFQFPPHNDHIHNISRVGPVNSMSQIRTVPAIPSDTSLFSPPPQNEDVEQNGSPQVDIAHQETHHPIQINNVSSNRDNNNIAQQYGSLTPFEENIITNNHYRNEKHDNQKFKKHGSYSDIKDHANTSIPCNSKNVTDASYNLSHNIVNSSTPNAQKVKTTPATQNQNAGNITSDTNNDYVTRKDLEVFIHGISDNIAKKIAHSDDNNEQEKISSMYIPPIFSTPRVTGSNENGTFQIPSPHLSMSEDVPNRSGTYQTPRPSSYETTTPSRKSTTGIESYLLSFPEGTEIFKSFLEGKPPASILFQSAKSNRNFGDSALNQSNPHAQSTPIKKNPDVKAFSSSPHVLGINSLPSQSDQRSLSASLSAKTPDNSATFRRTNGVTFASTENIIPTDKSNSGYKTSDSQRTSLTEIDQQSLQERGNSLNTEEELDISLLKEKIAQLETENSGLKQKLASTQESLLTEIRKRNHDNNRNNETINSLKNEIQKLSATLKSSHENMNQNTSYLTKKANDRALEIRSLKTQVKLLTGTARPLTPKEMPDFKPGSKTPSALYERLDMPLIDTLGVIEARNFLKNIVMQTGVNLHRLENKIAGLISCVCMTDMYIQFVNDLNQVLFKIPIDAKIYPFGDERKRTMAQIIHEVQNLITHYKNTTTKMNQFKGIK